MARSTIVCVLHCKCGMSGAWNIDVRRKYIIFVKIYHGKKSRNRWRITLQWVKCARYWCTYVNCLWMRTSHGFLWTSLSEWGGGGNYPLLAWLLSFHELLLVPNICHLGTDLVVKSGLHKFQTPNLQGDWIVYGCPWYLSVLSMGLASCCPSGTWNAKMASRCAENVCTFAPLNFTNLWL